MRRHQLCSQRICGPLQQSKVLLQATGACLLQSQVLPQLMQLRQELLLLSLPLCLALLTSLQLGQCLLVL